MRLLSVMCLMALALPFAVSQPLPLPQLPYGYSDLRPYYSEEALSLHHLGHHQVYTDKVNVALQDLRSRGGSAKALAKQGIDRILTHLDQVPDDLRTAIRNNGGGYVNHDLYWKSLAKPTLSIPVHELTASTPLSALVPRSGPSQSSALFGALQRDFGGVEAFKSSFANTAMSVFGSGWAWLYVHVDDSTPAVGTLRVRPSGNQDNPSILDQNARHVLLLCLDVWEHAYYVDYRNRRAAFVDAWWAVVDWQRAEQVYQAHVDAQQHNGGAQQHKHAEL